MKSIQLRPLGVGAAFFYLVFAAGCEPQAEPGTERNACAFDATLCGSMEGATCTPVGESFSCECPAGYASAGVGRRCEDINECADGPTDVCGSAYARCNNTPQGSFTCACPAGFEKQGPAPEDPCVDIDECATMDRQAICGVATSGCTNVEAGFLCECPSGWERRTVSGDTSGMNQFCVDIDECKNADFCSAICKNAEGSASCVSTVADESSPYWRYACPSADDRLIDNKTQFEMDCRCAKTQVGRPTDPSHPDFAAFNRCENVTDSGNFELGTGPSVRRWRKEFGADAGATRLNGGFLDHAERKVYVGAQWKDNTATDGNPEFTYYGAILSVDVDWSSPTVGNRALVSGYTPEGQRGAGPTLRAVQDIKRGADGMLYTMSWEAGHPAQMMRIDPATGDRTLIWKEQSLLHRDVVDPSTFPASQCHNGSTVGVDAITAGSRYSLQMTLTGQNLTMAPNGDFFLSASQNGPAKGPRGIVRISADGSKCTWVTRFAATNGNRYAPRAPADQGADYGLADGTGPLGDGPNNFASNPANLFYREDEAGVAWLYALDGIGSGGAGTRYYRVNVATGDRENLFSSIIGDTYSVWDPEREVLWTTGGYDTTRIVALDIVGHDGAAPTELGGIRCLSTTSDWYSCMRGPGDVDNQNRSGTFYDPLDGNLVIAHGSWGMVRVEVKTGNTYVFSR